MDPLCVRNIGDGSRGWSPPAVRCAAATGTLSDPRRAWPPAGGAAGPPGPPGARLHGPPRSASSIDRSSGALARARRRRTCHQVWRRLPGPHADRGGEIHSSVVWSARPDRGKPRRARTLPPAPLGRSVTSESPQPDRLLRGPSTIQRSSAARRRYLCVAVAGRDAAGIRFGRGGLAAGTDVSTPVRPVRTVPSPRRPHAHHTLAGGRQHRAQRIGAPGRHVTRGREPGRAGWSHEEIRSKAARRTIGSRGPRHPHGRWWRVTSPSTGCVRAATMGRSSSVVPTRPSARLRDPRPAPRPHRRRGTVRPFDRTKRYGSDRISRDGSRLEFPATSTPLRIRGESRDTQTCESPVGRGRT